MESSSTHPINNRIFALDVLRGFALLGILLMNIPFFGRSYHLHFNIDILQEYSGPNYWSWFIVNTFFEGTMRGIFSMLFGAGAILFIEGLQRKFPDDLRPADFYYRRVIWLLVFGMINAYVFNWAGDILYTYGIVGLFLFPFRNLKPWKLLAFGLLFLSISTWQYTSKWDEPAEKRQKGEAAQMAKSQQKPLSDEQKADLKSWLEYQQENSRERMLEKVEESNKEMEGDYWAIQGMLAYVNESIQTEDFYHEYFFDALSFFLIGMALLRLGFLSGELSTGVYLTAGAISYAIGLGLNLWFISKVQALHFDLSLYKDTFHIHPYQIRRLFLALGHISLIQLLLKIPFGPWLFRPLEKVGRMAFTNYLGQTLICTLVFFGYGLGYFGKWQRYELYLFVACVWVFQILFSVMWLHFFMIGPFEWIWRSLTWWKVQPILRSRNAG